MTQQITELQALDIDAHLTSRQISSGRRPKPKHRACAAPLDRIARSLHHRVRFGGNRPGNRTWATGDSTCWFSFHRAAGGRGFGFRRASSATARSHSD
jgi:hypothetical protein